MLGLALLEIFGHRQMDTLSFTRGHFDSRVAEEYLAQKDRKILNQSEEHAANFCRF